MRIAAVRSPKERRNNAIKFHSQHCLLPVTTHHPLACNNDTNTDRTSFPRFRTFLQQARCLSLLALLHSDAAAGVCCTEWSTASIRQQAQYTILALHVARPMQANLHCGPCTGRFEFVRTGDITEAPDPCTSPSASAPTVGSKPKSTSTEHY